MRGEGQTRLHSFDSAELPVANHPIPPGSCAAGVLATKRQVIGCVDHCDVTDVEGSPAIIRSFRIERIRSECRGVRRDAGVQTIAVVERLRECIDSTELQSVADAAV